ncbi:MAG: hypothetical protein ACTS41_01480 [Candidatus Hodgkinia cicadicola]
MSKGIEALLLFEGPLSIRLLMSPRRLIIRINQWKENYQSRISLSTTEVRKSDLRKLTTQSNEIITNRDESR